MLDQEALRRMPHDDFPAITGRQVVGLMRTHRVTIRQLAKRNGLTLKRIREIRETGCPAGFLSWELHWMVAHAAECGEQ